MPKALILVTEDWFFVSHFLPIARAISDAGFEVTVATRVRDHGDRIAAEGFRVIALEADRRSLGPIEILRSVWRIRKILQSERPDVVHCIALRMVVLGGLVGYFAGSQRLVLALTGLGHLWTEGTIFHRVARLTIRLIISRVLRGPRVHYLFENTDDPKEFELSAPAQVTIVPGAGVDAEDFPEAPEPVAPPIKVAVVARMLHSKGIPDAVQAIRYARARTPDLELDLYGAPDPSNRGSCSEHELQRWNAEPGIRWHGHTREVGRVWREHHIAMLLTRYREGVPRTLIEAASAGRPIITTDTPGCRDLVRDGIEGYLVPINDPEAAARALVRLASDPGLRNQMGNAALRRFRERYTKESVMRIVGELYRRFASSPTL